MVALDDRVLGKPRDEAHAMAMLRALSGRMHRVLSAVAVAGVPARDADAGGRRDAASHGGPAGDGDTGIDSTRDATTASAFARAASRWTGLRSASPSAPFTGSGSRPPSGSSRSRTEARVLPRSGLAPSIQIVWTCERTRSRLRRSMRGGATVPATIRAGSR